MRSGTPHHQNTRRTRVTRPALAQGRHRAAWVVSLIACTCVVACAFNSVRPGMSRQEAIARMGQPSREMPLPGGTRLQYSRQPAGQQVYNVDLDAGGQVLQVRQMLVASEFARIAVGSWTRDDVLQAFGPPASVDHVANWPGDILTYRWHDVQDMFFWVYLDPANVVRRTGQGVEYHHDD